MMTDANLGGDTSDMNEYLGADTPDMDEYLGADENLSRYSLNMDGSYGEYEDSAADGNPSEADIDADDLELGEDTGDGSSVDSSADDALDNRTMRKALEQMIHIISGNEEAHEKALEYAQTIRELRLQVRHQAASVRAEGKLRTAVEGLKKENRQLRVELKRKADRDGINEVIYEANKQLRLDLDGQKAQLRKERDEKADYHRIKEERTDFHRRFLKETRDCIDLREHNAELLRMWKGAADTCTGLEEENAELRRKLDVEARFSAQAMAMFSKNPEA